MITPALTELLVAAVHATTQMHHKHAQVEVGRLHLNALEKQLDHNAQVVGSQVTHARTLIHALIERRTEAIQSGFTAVLALYAEQARHYMQQQDKYTEASFAVTDALMSAKYRARLAEIDRQLSRIREDSHLLYQEMNTMLYLIGATMPAVPGEDQGVLQLPC